MWRYTMTLLLIMLCGVLLLPRGAVERNRRVTPDPETEMKAKHTLLSKDIQATDDLCRSQCILSLQQTARDLGGGKQQVAQALKKLQKEHPHMKTIYWSDNNQDLTQAIVAGEPNGAVNQLASADLAKAKENAKRGETFLSKTIEKRRRALHGSRSPDRRREGILDCRRASADFEASQRPSGEKI